MFKHVHIWQQPPSFTAHCWAASTEHLGVECFAQMLYSGLYFIMSWANFPVQYKSQKLSTPKIGSVSILLLRWVFLKCVCTWPVTFHPLLSLTDQRELRGDGRNHYITKHPVAIVLSNCRTTLLQHSPQTSGHVVCAIAQTQEGKDNRERKKAGNNEIMRKTEEWGEKKGNWEKA